MLVALPHSRGQESEADRMGLRYMARAGYYPENAVAFWQRFADFNKSHGGAQVGADFLSGDNGCTFAPAASASRSSGAQWLLSALGASLSGKAPPTFSL